jgi:hypothetical protein
MSINNLDWADRTERTYEAFLQALYTIDTVLPKQVAAEMKYDHLHEGHRPGTEGNFYKSICRIKKTALFTLF